MSDKWNTLGDIFPPNGESGSPAMWPTAMPGYTSWREIIDEGQVQTINKIQEEVWELLTIDRE